MSKPPVITAEVWGDPIDHSRSPDLHLACYRHLGYAGTYTRRQVAESQLAGAFRDNREQLTGISLTMPLKTGIVGLVADHRGFVTTLTAANTAVKSGEGWWLDNTDPIGAHAMLSRLLPSTADPVWIVGAGATAKAVLAGLSLAHHRGPVALIAREESRAAGAIDIGRALGLDVSFQRLGEDGPGPSPALIVSTLPSGTVLGDAVSTLIGPGAPLVDVGYSPWPTPLAASFLGAGCEVHSGLPMLMFQALAQIRCFVNGDRTLPLDDEAGALKAMAEAIGVGRDWADPSLMGE